MIKRVITNQDGTPFDELERSVKGILRSVGMDERVIHRKRGVIPGCVMLDGEAPERYRGPLPSKELLAFVAGMERKNDDQLERGT